MRRKRVAILISGRGSNMAALIDAARASDYPAEIVLVASNRTDAAGLELATEIGVPTAVLDQRGFTSKANFEAALDVLLNEAQVELVCLAGFMRLLSADFVDRWRDRLINIHPSLLPAFRGLDTHARVLAAGAKIHGCTVHFVRAAMDNGPIIAQAEIMIRPGDTPETLAERVLEAEHQLYPEALALVASGRVRVEDERVTTAP